MTKPIKLTAAVPFFPGFYESHLSAAIDHEEQQHIENCCNERDHETDESAYPEQLRLDESDLFGIYFRHTDYRAAYTSLARGYAETLDSMLGAAMGLTVTKRRAAYSWEQGKTVAYEVDSAGVTFESVDSPREYNFTTDRLYVDVPLKVFRQFMRQSKAENHETLRRVIRENHSSRSGFISFYSDDLGDWLDKSIQEFDHNELGTLLSVGMELNGLESKSGDYCDSIEGALLDGETAYSAWSNAVNWPAVEADILQARADALAVWLEDERESVLSWANSKPAQFDAIAGSGADSLEGLQLEQLAGVMRCRHTVDLFPNA